MTKAAKKEDDADDAVAPKGDNNKFVKFADRINKLIEDRNNINMDIAGVYSEALNHGFDRKAFKETIKVSRKEMSEEHRDLVNQYLEMLGKKRIYDIVG
jgi:uncharacterized protein (UPF0335 family)